MIDLTGKIDLSGRWIYFSAVTLLALTLFFIYYSLFGFGFTNQDTFDYAQIARQLVEGRGFTTKQVNFFHYLAALRHLGPLAPPWPSLFRFPLPSLMIAFFFLLFGVSEMSAMSMGGVCYALSAGMLFLVAEKILRSRPRAFLAALAFALSDSVLTHAISDWSTNITVFPFTLSLLIFIYAWMKVAERPSSPSCFILGLLAGSAYLVRYNFLSYFPVAVFALIMLHRARWKAIFLWSSAGFIVLAGAWWIRNLAETGNPFFTLYNYISFPYGIGCLHDLTMPWNRQLLGPVSFLLKYPGVLLHAYLQNLGENIRHLPGLFKLYLFLPWLLLRFWPARSTARTNYIFYLLVLLLLVQLLLSSIVGFDERHYLQFAPLFILFAFEKMWAVFASFRIRAFWRAVIIAITILFIWNPFRLLNYKNAGVPINTVKLLHREDQLNMDYLRRRLPPEAIVISDTSWWIAWGAKLNSVRLFTPPETIAEVNKDLLRIDAVYLSPALLLWHQGIYRPYLEWLKRKKYRTDFYLDKVFKNGAVLLVRKSAKEQAPGGKR